VQALLPQLHDLSAMTVCNCVQTFFILRHANRDKSGTNTVRLLDPYSNVYVSRVHILSNGALVYDLDFGLDVAKVILSKLFCMI
jgi:hypothetical protein